MSSWTIDFKFLSAGLKVATKQQKLLGGLALEVPLHAELVLGRSRSSGTPQHSPRP